MIFITAKFRVLPQHADRWPEIASSFTAATQAESGCLWFEWSRSLLSRLCRRIWPRHPGSSTPPWTRMIGRSWVRWPYRHPSDRTQRPLFADWPAEDVNSTIGGTSRTSS